MFELGLSEEQRIIRETARRFAEERLAPRAREHERARSVPQVIVDEFSGLGLGAADASSALDQALVLEELGAGDAGAALAIDRFGLAAHVLCEGRLDDLIHELRSHTEVRACAVFDPEAALETAADRVSGSVPWVPADRADLVVLLQPSRALVVRNGCELRAVRTCGLEAAGASELLLRQAPIIARVDDGAAVARAWTRSRVHVAALLVGVARAAREYATRYATERVAFGRPIAHHQALAFLLVDLAIAVDSARLGVWRAAAELDRGTPASWEGAAAFAEAAEQALAVGPSAVQVLGGHGFMKDHPVEKFMRDIRTLAQLAGGRDLAEIECATLAPAHEVRVA